MVTNGETEGAANPLFITHSPVDAAPKKRFTKRVMQLVR
jgi:hypothetical protein